MKKFLCLIIMSLFLQGCAGMKEHQKNTQDEEDIINLWKEVSK